ncbi:MAG: DUF2179 domain-containing protein [Chloroflexi bacterium]|nr:DUF2179 domain-containing protein [Chloroflexota bacterium]
MELILTREALLLAAFIFVLRVINQSLDTLRIMFMLRGSKLWAWILGFAETTIFVVTLSSVINDLNNITNIVAYAAGFATGNTLGIWLEARLAIGHLNVRIVSPKRGSALVERLRQEGFAITEIPARGKDGAVSLLNASVRRRDVNKVREIVAEVDESAFITGEEMRPLGRGFWGG